MKCPLCNNKSILFMKGIFDCNDTLVMECENCKLHFLEPKMSISEEAEYYRNYYENQKIRQQKKYTMKDIQNNALKHYNEYSDVFNSLINGANSILEIGSGSGGFLRFIKENLPDSTTLHSVEKSESNLEFLKKDFPNVEFYDDIDNVNNQKYDVIAGFGVLEHIRDPEDYINKLKFYLKDSSSKIVFSIPNNNDILISFFKLEEYKKFMYMKQHYYVFSEESLYELAKNCGMSVEKINYIQAWGIDNHLSWLNARKSQNFDSYSEVFNKSLDREYKKNLMEKGMTDLIQVVLSKGE